MLDLPLDLLADAVALLLEQADLAINLALDDVLPDFQKAKLAPDLLFEPLQGRQWHEIHAKS
jgi:hypothetical protein